MRRPAPLPIPSRPAPPRRRSTDASADGVADDASPTGARPAGRAGDGAHSDGTASTAPHGTSRATVTPFVREPTDDTHVDDARPIGTAEAAVGFRDVWRAARDRRRALRAEMRRFTARNRRRRVVWLSAAAAVLLLVAATFGVSYSPLFAVRRIDVIGTHGLRATTVERALRGQIGTPLPLVSTAAVAKALGAFPRVQSFSLQARPPHDLVVRIVERTPVGVVKTATGYDVVDAAGVTVATASAPAAGRPLITAHGGVHSAAFRAAGQVLRELPVDVRDKVTAVTAASPDDVALALAGGHTSIVWGGADDSAKKALVLATIMRARPPSTVRVYDVSAPDAVVVR